MRTPLLWITAIFSIVLHSTEVFGDCSGVTSQTLNYGDSRETSMIRPSIISPVTCTWEVKSTSNSLLVEVENLDIPHSQMCEQGYLQFTVGEYGKFDSVAMDKWCGEFYPRTLYLSGQVTIKLSLQPSPTGAGIKIKFTSVFSSEFCKLPVTNLTGSGYIYSPGYGGHWTVSPSLSCQWHIVTDPGHAVQVELQHVDFGQWACSRQDAKLTAYDGTATGPQIDSWCSSNVLEVAKSRGSSLALDYVDSVPHRGTGFILKYYPVPDYHSECAGSERYITARRTPSFIEINVEANQRQKFCRWNITAENENDLVVMETEYYDIGTLDCSYFELDYFDGPQPDGNNLQSKICNGTKLPSHRLFQSSGRHAHLIMRYNPPPIFTKTIKALIRVYTVPKTPCWEDHSIYTADESLSRVWLPVSNTTQHSTCDIRIESSDPNTCLRVEVAGIDGHILSIHDFFHVYDGSNTSSNKYEPRCSAVSKEYTYSTGPAILLVRKLSPLGGRLSMDGLWLTYHTDENCQVGDFIELGTETRTYQSLTIPAYMDQLVNTAQLCQYVLSTKSSSSVIQVSVTAHSSPVDCSHTTVILSDDMSIGGEIGLWCNIGSGHVYSSSGNVMYVTYMAIHNESDLKNQPSLYFRAWPKEMCHKELLAPEGSALNIWSPYYPNLYPNLASCVWRITTPGVNFRVEMHVQEMDMDTGSAGNCSGDYLTFNDGPNESARELRRLCGKDITQRPIQSSGSVMTVQFHSDNKMVARGFKASYLAVKVFKCNETLIAPSANGPNEYISSPFFPNHYGRNMKCFWLLKTSEDHVIQTFMALAEFTGSGSGSGSGSSCRGDHLTFYNGRDAKAPVIGRICGNEMPRYRSSGRYMYIVFESNDDDLTAQGFQLQYYSDYLYSSCQGSNVGVLYGNRSKAGFLESPFYPSGFPTGLSCRWNIMVNIGYTVDVTVDQSNVAENCDVFQVRFYDGSSKSAKRLGQWCGDKDRHFTSTGDTLHLSLHTMKQTTGGFRLAYKANGAGIFWYNTALVVGIILGSLLLIVLVATICICYCCCCRKRKETESEDSEESSSESKWKSAGQPLITGKDNHMKDSGVKNGALVPSAPPMELVKGIDNAGFQFPNKQEGKRSAQSIYPVLDNALDLQRSDVIGMRGTENQIGGYRGGSRANQQVTGNSRGRHTQTGHADHNVSNQHNGDFRGAYIDLKEDRKGFQGGAPEGITEHMTRLHPQEQMRFETDQRAREAPVVGHEVGGDSVLMRDVNQPGLWSNPGDNTLGKLYPELKIPKNDLSQYVTVIEYGGKASSKNVKKEEKKKNNKTKEKKQVDVAKERKSKRPLKKLSSIECNEDEVDKDGMSSLTQVLQERHADEQKALNFDQQYRHSGESHIPYGLPQTMYPGYPEYANQDYQVPWQPYPEHPTYFTDGMLPVPVPVPVPSGQANQVVQAEIHGLSLNGNLSSSPRSNGNTSPRVQNMQNWHQNVFDPSAFVQAPIQVHPNNIWSTRGSALPPLGTVGIKQAEDPNYIHGFARQDRPREHDIKPFPFMDTEPKHPSWHHPSRNTYIPIVPMLVPIQEQTTNATHRAESQEDFQIDLSDMTTDSQIDPVHCKDTNYTCSRLNTGVSFDVLQDGVHSQQDKTKSELDQEKSGGLGKNIEEEYSQGHLDGASIVENMGSRSLKMSFPEPTELLGFLPPAHWVTGEMSDKDEPITHKMSTQGEPVEILVAKEVKEEILVEAKEAKEKIVVVEEEKDMKEKVLDLEKDEKMVLVEEEGDMKKDEVLEARDKRKKIVMEEGGYMKEKVLEEWKEKIVAEVGEDVKEVIMEEEKEDIKEIPVMEREEEEGGTIQDEERKIEILRHIGFTSHDVENMSETVV